MVMLGESSVDHKSQQDSFSRGHECLYKISWSHAASVAENTNTMLTGQGHKTPDFSNTSDTLFLVDLNSLDAVWTSLVQTCRV